MSSRPSEDSLHIVAPLDAAMAVVSDVATYPQWQPSIERSEVTGVDDAGRPIAARFGARVGPWLASYAVLLQHGDRSLTWTLQQADLLRRYEGGWHVAPVDGDPTRCTVTYRLLVVPKAPSPRFIVDQATHAELRTALTALAGHLEDTRAAPPPGQGAAGPTSWPSWGRGPFPWS